MNTHIGLLLPSGAHTALRLLSSGVANACEAFGHNKSKVVQSNVLAFISEVKQRYYAL